MNEPGNHPRGAQRGAGVTKRPPIFHSLTSGLFQTLWHYQIVYVSSVSPSSFLSPVGCAKAAEGNQGGPVLKVSKGPGKTVLGPEEGGVNKLNVMVGTVWR